MNKIRRKEISQIYDKLSSIIFDLDILKDRLESVKEEEQESLDNLPENLQYSSRAEEMEENVDNLDNSIDYLSQAIESLQESIDIIVDYE